MKKSVFFVIGILIGVILSYNLLFEENEVDNSLNQTESGSVITGAVVSELKQNLPKNIVKENNTAYWRDEDRSGGWCRS